MSNFSKIFVTSTKHAPSQITYTDVPKIRLLITPLKDFELTYFNSASDYISSSQFRESLKNDWLIAYNEYNQNIDVLFDTAVDFIDSPVYTDGQVPTYDTNTGTFIPSTPSGGGGSDSFLRYSMTAVSDVTISHTLGRLANVKVFENEQEIEVLITYPTGFETSKVRIQSNQPITGFAILT